jgi:hypothetical protein
MDKTPCRHPVPHTPRQSECAAGRLCCQPQVQAWQGEARVRTVAVDYEKAASIPRPSRACSCGESSPWLAVWHPPARSVSPTTWTAAGGPPRPKRNRALVSPAAVVRSWHTPAVTKVVGTTSGVLEHVPKLGLGFQTPVPGAFVQWFCDTLLEHVPRWLAGANPFGGDHKARRDQRRSEPTRAREMMRAER